MKSPLDYRSHRLDEILPELAREALQHAQRIRHFSDGQLIFNQGDESTDLLIIIEGSIRIGRVDEVGRETTVGVLGPGHYLGLVGVILDRPRGQTAIAVGDTTAGFISKAALDSALQSTPTLAQAMLPLVLSRLNAALNAIDDRQRLPLSVYTASVLEEILESSDDKETLSWSQADIAVAVGASRVSVGKALKNLESLGLISLKYSKIEIPDPQALRDWISTTRLKYSRGE